MTNTAPTIPPGRVYGYSSATISINGRVIAESGTSQTYSGSAPFVYSDPPAPQMNRKQRRAMRARRRRGL